MGNRSLISVDNQSYSNVSVGVQDGPVFFLSHGSTPQAATLATLSYLEDYSHYVNEGDQTWAELADVVYILLPGRTRLMEVWLNSQTTNTDVVYTHVVSKATGERLFTWKN